MEIIDKMNHAIVSGLPCRCKAYESELADYADTVIRLHRDLATLQADLAESEKWQKQFFDDLQDSINKRLELEAELAQTQLEAEAFLKKYNCKRAYAAWQKRKEGVTIGHTD